MIINIIGYDIVFLSSKYKDVPGDACPTYLFSMVVKIPDNPALKSFKLNLYLRVLLLKISLSFKYNLAASYSQMIIILWERNLLNSDISLQRMSKRHVSYSLYKL